MLKRTRLRTERQQNGMLVFSITFLLSTTAILVNFIDFQLQLRVNKYINSVFFILIFTVALIQTVIWLIRNQAYKGIKYAIRHYLTVLSLRRAFLDANYCNKDFI